LSKHFVYVLAFFRTMASVGGNKRRYKDVQPDVQEAIVEDYRQGVRGHGYLAIAKKHHLPVQTVQRVIARAARAGGDPIAPRGHKKRKLDSGEEAKLCRALDRNPTATNRQLRTVVRGKIAVRTVSDYLARANPPFSTKTIQDQEPEELTEAWKAEARKWLNGVKRLRLDKRIYEDETPVYANEAPKRGRARRGTPIFRARSRYAKKYTLHVYAKCSGVLHWDLSDRNADTEEIERVAVDAAERMEQGDVLIWDRLGRSGRALNPTSQHYSPVARAAFEACGVTMRFLPPKGKYFNPLELLFNDLKQHQIRPNFPKNGKPLSKQKIVALVRGYMDGRAPGALSGFFRARANGRDAVDKQIL
jgi:transposase